MNKKNRLLKTDSDTHQKLKNLSLELSYIEGIKVPMGEIPKRVLGDSEIIERLKLGSKERRLRLK